MGQTGKPKVLVIDDDEALVDLIQQALTDEGMVVFGAYDATEGLRLFYQIRPDLVILDIMLPGRDGWQVCRQLRQVSYVPIVMLTARRESTDLLRGLNLGADDYMTKPFSLDVLRARIEALLRRAARPELTHPPRRHDIGDLSIDMLAREVTIAGRLVPLSPREFDLLAYLVRHAGRTVPREELLQQVWGPEYVSENHYLSLYICYLRRHIEENPQRPQRIVTWRGLGYRFVPRLSSLPG